MQSTSTGCQLGCQLLRRIAAVAGVFTLVVAAVLLYDYATRNIVDPATDPSLVALKSALAQQPDNEKLQEEIRGLDFQLRQEYYRQRALRAVGAVLALAGAAVFLVAAAAAAALGRTPPAPEPQAAPVDLETAAARAARWAVAAMALVVVASSVGVAVWLRGELPGRSKLASLAAGGGPPASGAAAQGTDGREAPTAGGAGTSSPEKLPPPTDEEVARMWPRFRGPGGLGISAYDNVPTKWDAAASENIAWKTEVPLPGNNSPVVWADRVFLSGADETHRQVYCFDAAKGQLLWQKDVPGTPESTAEPPKVNDDTGFAAPTVATDGRWVFAIFANGDAAAFAYDGTLGWSRSLGMPDNSYGHASSLNVYKDWLLVQFDQGNSKNMKSKLLALEAATGKTAWELDRPVPNSWTTPIVARIGQRDQLITAADPWVIAYDLEEKKEAWRAKCLRYDVGPSPTVADGVVYVASEFPCLSAIRADGAGDVTESNVLWTGEDDLPDTCSPLATSEYVFLLASYGTLTCYDAKEGEMLWQQEFDAPGFSASPSLVGKLLYLVDLEGKTWIVEPSRTEAKQVSEGSLGEPCVASPAFQDGRIYMRGQQHLFCIGKGP